MPCMALAQSVKSQQPLIDAIGRRMGMQAKAFDAKLDELRQQISSSVIIERIDPRDAASMP